jgi:hypothetical protein
MPRCNDPEKEILRREKIRIAHTGRKRPPISEETRKRMRDSAKGKTLSQKHRENISKSGKGRIPWNKGLRCPHKEETKKKIGLGNKGKVRSKEERELLSIKCSGRTHTEEERTKMRIKRKDRIISKDTCKNISKALTGKPKSEEHRQRLSEVRILSGCSRGERNPNWRGGIAYLPYCYKFNERRKKACRDFFGGFCIVTGVHQNDMIEKNSVHHIDHDKEQGCNGKPFNLVPMNRSEHSKEQHKKQEYIIYINKTLREGFKWGIWNEQEYIEKVMYDE